MKNYQEYQILNDLSTPAISFDGLEISDRPPKKKNGTQKRPVNKSGTSSTFAFDPVHDIDFKEFLELDTGVEFNREGKMNPCPMCGHNDCCSVIPNEPALMMCFSAEHDEAFNIWAYMEKNYGLTGHEAVQHTADVMGISLNRTKPTTTRNKRKPKLKLITATEMINDSRPKPEDLIGSGLLPSSSLLIISGKEKSYKSLISLDIALHLVSGHDWQRHCICKPYKCIVLSAEGGYFSLRERLRRMSAGFKDQVNLENLLLPVDVSINLLEPEDYELLVQILSQHKPDVLIFDPLVRFHDGDENTSNEMAAVMGALRELIQQFDLSIILIHHDTKNGGAMRGSSVIGSEYDSMMHLTIKDGKKPTNINVHYSLRHAESPSDTGLIFHPDTFSFEQGREQPTTAREAIIAQLESGGMERKILKTAILSRGGFADKTINNQLRKMIINGELKDKDDFLELVSQG